MTTGVPACYVLIQCHCDKKGLTDAAVFGECQLIGKWLLSGTRTQLLILSFTRLLEHSLWP